MVFLLHELLVLALLVHRNPLVLIYSRLVEVLLLYEGEVVDQLQQLLQDAVHLVVLVRQKGLVHDARHELLLDQDELVQVLSLLYLVLKYFPTRLQNLYHYVIVDVRNKMNHFVMAQIKFMELVFHTFNFLKLMTMLHI